MGTCCHKEPDPFGGGLFSGMMSKEDKKKMKAEMKKAGMNPNGMNDMGALFSQAFNQMGQAFQQAAQEMQKQEEAKGEEENKQIELEQVGVVPILTDEKHYQSDESDRSQIGINVEDVELKLEFDQLASKNLNDEQLTAAIKREENILTDITGLDLSGNKLSVQIIPVLLQKFPGITSLTLACNQMESLDKLSEYLKNSNIISLALGGNKFTVESIVDFIEEMGTTSLAHLGLVGLNLKDKGAISVMEKVASSNIAYIDLSLNAITDAGLEEISEIGFQGKVIHLSRNSITTKGFSKFLQNIEKFPNLKYFDIRGNQLNDRAAIVQAFLEFERKDIIFKVRSNPGISWKVIDELSALKFTVEKGAKIDEKILILAPFKK